MKYQKYILFAGDRNIPAMGLLAIKGSFDTVQGANDHFLFSQDAFKNNWDWYQIVDRDTWQIVVGMDSSGTG